MSVITEVAPGFHVIENRHVEGKSGLVVTGAKAIIFDAGADLSEGRLILNAVRDVTDLVPVVVYSHGHWDHVRGGPAIEAEEFICHLEAAASVNEQLGEVSRGLPTRTFELSLQLGTKQNPVELIALPGHAPGATVLWSSSSKVLFASDTVVTSIPPVFRDGDSAALLSSLRQIAKLGAHILVPGHGHVVTGREPVQRMIARVIRYLENARELVQASVANGVGVDQLIDDLSDEVEVRNLYPLHPERSLERHRNMYRDLWVEATRGKDLS